uniref:Uncharacterized protein n=1 Tax=Rhizophora mucronata TaxID=61149 RepID=A0A2P2QRR1_RHIMU
MAPMTNYSNMKQSKQDMYCKGMHKSTITIFIINTKGILYQE